MSKHNESIEQVVRDAGKILLGYWKGREDAATYAIEHKADGTSVTEADYASNELLMKALSDNFPEDAILSEEVPRQSDVFSNERVWIIDPLDGTQAFIDGRDDFSILLGLCEEGQCTYGIAYFPARDWFCKGTLGQGAFNNEIQLFVSQNSELRAQKTYLRYTELSSMEYAYPDQMDSGLALYSVASGDLDAVVIRLGRHQEWDLAAPSVLIQEAGGKISDEHGAPISFGASGFSGNYFIASNGKVHEQLLGMIPA